MFTASAERQQAIVASLERAWQAPLPAGLISAHCFASVGGESVLLFLQWSGEQAARGLQSVSNDELHSLGLEPFGNANSPIYRRYRSLGGAATGQQASSLI